MIENLKDYMDEMVDKYNTPEFALSDPIQIPKAFQNKQDIEIAAFLTATIAWGNRKSIIQSAQKMMMIMGNSPFDFVMNAQPNKLSKYTDKAIHRTFSTADFNQFILNLKRIYQKVNSLEQLFLVNDNEANFYHSLHRFRSTFLIDSSARSHKHISSTYKNVAAKRLVMLLRWLVRKDKRGVDIGIWNELPMDKLSIPMDVHTGNVSRKLGLITRKQNDWKAVEELDRVVRSWDAQDPAKYDYALFGIGLFKEIET